MDAALASITAISLALAIVMGMIVFRLLREERERSDARVALLAAAARPLDSSFDPRAEAYEDSAAAARRAWLLRAAGAALVIVLGLGAVYALSGRDHASAVATPETPLQLLALVHRHAPEEARGLTITGVVRNPRGNRPAEGLTATAAIVGSDGTVVATAQVRIDDPNLAAGEESPFVIKVPVRGSVSRYRVGFRGPDGRVIAHIDLRSAPSSSARNRQDTGSTSWVH